MHDKLFLADILDGLRNSILRVFAHLHAIWLFGFMTSSYIARPPYYLYPQNWFNLYILKLNAS